MKISKRARRDAKQLFRSCVLSGLLDDDRVRQTVQQIIAQKPRGYLGILTHFQRLVKLDVARRTARIESAIQLPESLSTAIQANLARRYGPGLAVSFAQKQDLIGGLRVQVGSDVYDGSIRARLAELADRF
jgi:F-type H+-transporting ATPase subunit delta